MMLIRDKAISDFVTNHQPHLQIVIGLGCVAILLGGAISHFVFGQTLHDKYGRVVSDMSISWTTAVAAAAFALLALRGAIVLFRKQKAKRKP
jgi:TRAP-type C4-dicarboxylate transport system permease small subunit